MIRPIQVPVGSQRLFGDLGVPAGAIGLVLFAHGSGSSRQSPRNQFVARALEERGLATLLADLLTRGEEAVDQHTGHYRFDIDMLGSRLVTMIEWLGQNDETSAFSIGIFGASTGGGAALVAAAARPNAVKAVVSRGGRPDLAASSLRLVKAPTLLIVGGHDEPVIEMNREAMTQMPGHVELAIVRGATHLFEEPGALERVAALAGDWFVRYLSCSTSSERERPKGGSKDGAREGRGK